MLQYCLDCNWEYREACIEAEDIFPWAKWSWLTTYDMGGEPWILPNSYVVPV